MKNSALAAAATLALAGLLFLHGAVPFLAAPTLAQALWTSGFAQSFANGSLAAHATNFGAPQPAPISFGLAGAWPQALLLALGLRPAEAYPAMVALWLGVAFFCAFRFARLLGAGPGLAVGGALVWLGMPVIWAHADYSMLALGIALLPFYFLCALLLQQREPRASYAALYLLACLVAVFMDGYTFVMFVVGASLLGGWLYARAPSRRRELLRWALPVHLAGVGLAYVCYVSYVGVQDYGSAPLEAFRAWGLDLAFLAVPAEGVHWLPDALGWSSARSEERFFGDAPVWRSTFALPLLVAAGWAWWTARRASPLAGGLALVLVAGLYLSLGPSLKVHAIRPTGSETGKAMAAGEALAPTGTAWLSTHVPGLRDMRGAYRWLALAIFSAWSLVMLRLAARSREDRLLAAVLLGSLAALNLPHPAQKWRQDVHNRESMLRIDAELAADLARDLRRGERVAFAPPGNDVLVNYLAARLEIVSYNIGGDKNLAHARHHWPQTLQQIRTDAVEQGFPAQALLLLVRGEADGVVLPHVDLLEGSRRWPAPPPRFAEDLHRAVATLRASQLGIVVERERYALVRLDPGAGTSEEAVLRELCAPPICLRQGPFSAAGAPAPLAAGLFRVRVHGAGRSRGHGRVELVSGQGSARHASIALVAAPEGARSGILAEGYLMLPGRVEDLQLRVVSGEGDMLRLDGYEVIPLPRQRAKAP